MKALLNQQNWAKAVAAIGIVTAMSLPAQAADREDVAIGVIAGVAAGYVLADRRGDVRVSYRHHDDNYRHRHYGQYPRQCRDHYHHDPRPVFSYRDNHQHHHDWHGYRKHYDDHDRYAKYPSRHFDQGHPGKGWKH